MSSGSNTVQGASELWVVLKPILLEILCSKYARF